MNSLDTQYQQLLEDILQNGVKKQDRTGTGTISVFGRQIRHKMSEGFPLLTTKKMHWKSIVTELLWFLSGDTNIKFLLDYDCHIWDGDAYKNYLKGGNIKWLKDTEIETPLGKMNVPIPYTKEEFIDKIKTYTGFAKQWGNLGPIYGKQWRSWESEVVNYIGMQYQREPIDQIANLIKELKTNPDSRRLMVSAWNVGDLDQMVLPPCHYGFQMYTRELSWDERHVILKNRRNEDPLKYSRLDNGDYDQHPKEMTTKWMNELNIPTRAISLMWNQRSVDTPLGLPFNIASYGLLLEIIAKSVGMIPDELIGNLGDCHIYSNQIDGVLENIGRRYTTNERSKLLEEAMGEFYQTAIDEQVPFAGGMIEYYQTYKIPHYTREPFELPKLNINTEFWPTEGGECGIGLIDAISVFDAFKSDAAFCLCLLEDDIQLYNYQCHPKIKIPLSN
jgi:thymidylate synthase